MRTKTMIVHPATMLAITSGFILGPPGAGNGFSEMHELIEFIVGHPVWTHQVPRKGKAAAAHLLKTHSWLAEIELPESFDGPEHAERFCRELEERHGREFEITPIEGGTKPVNPLAELVNMVRPEKVITVVVGEEKR